MAQFGEQTLKASMLRNLTKEQKAVVFAQLPLGGITVSGAIAVLKNEYGRDVMVQQQADTVKFRSHERTSESLRDWLREHNLRKAQAIGAAACS